MRSSFSPIYDSGSSLGRELSAERISIILDDDQKMEQYIKKGLSDIRWNDKQLNHLELLKVIKLDYRSIFDGIIQEVKQKYVEQKNS